jgi:triosephosphate isomerase
MTAGSAARKPLMAGNWKMHNTHFEGLALVQKLAFSLTDADFAAVDVAVLPPFTALRSVQTLVAGTGCGFPTVPRTSRRMTRGRTPEMCPG